MVEPLPERLKKKEWWKNDNELDPANLLPFSKELVYEEGHKPIEGSVYNEPYES